MSIAAAFVSLQTPVVNGNYGNASHWGVPDSPLSPFDDSSGIIYDEVRSHTVGVNFVDCFSTDVKLLRVEGYVDPQTYWQAMRRSEPEAKMYRKEAQEEMDYFFKNKIVEYADGSKLPKDKLVMDVRWVCHMKFDSQGNADRARMRFVPKGFQARLGLEYSQYGTFSPVAKQQSLYFCFSEAAQHGLKTRCIDVTKAFLYGECKEEVYVKCPDGFNDPAGLPYGKNTVLRCRKQIYGMKSAAREFFNVLVKHMCHKS
jgi:hypothetical protein